MGGCEREGVRWEGGTCHNDKPGPSDAEWNLVEIKWWRYFFPLPFAGGAKTAGFPPHVCMSWPLLSVYIFFFARRLYRISRILAALNLASVVSIGQEGSRDLQKGHPSVTKGASPSAKGPSTLKPPSSILEAPFSAEGFKPP